MTKAQLIASLNTLGTLLIAYTALAVHRRVWQKHKIDGAVFRSMGREQIIGFTGMLLILAAYLIEIL